MPLFRKKPKPSSLSSAFRSSSICLSPLLPRQPLRSLTQRLRTPPSIDADASDQSWPSSPTDKPEDPEPRRSKRSLFSFHSAASASSVRDQSGLLRPNRSVKRSSGPNRRQSHQPRLSVDTWPQVDAGDSTEPEQHQSSMPQPTRLVPAARAPQSPSIPRSNTDSNLLEHPRRAGEFASTPHHQLTPRPPSRQSIIGPPSPLPGLPPTEPSSAAQLSVMSDRPAGGAQQNQPAAAAAHPAYQSEAGFRNNPAQQSGPDPGHSTPTSSRDSRNREDGSEIDVRALLQKHEELQAKYSKVKRYYFERDTQVQQLQNTVAHQRMAVSRTVLDDNEYANRFGRLDGAIKDLAFSIRKDWKTLPGWLGGFVNEDAPTTGTKEMTAIGRALMSRWLVDELFARYFHPVLEPTLSRQLKGIEMNLRRQQGGAYTDEDKENSLARISNWRRTTLDGLADALQGPAADESRAQLIETLVETLVATLARNLTDPPPPGLDNGVRMIVENAVGIAEKIPLESRDIGVDYILPGTALHEGTMKIEAGVLPPLTNVSAGCDSPSHPRRSGEHDTTHHSDAGPEDADPEREPSSSGNPAAPPPDASSQGREQRIRSVFSNMLGRKSGQGPSPPPPPPPPPPPGPGDSVRSTSTEERRVASGGAGSAPTGRIRFASFVVAEVRGRGPLNVLVKAPVYPLDA
ncbi:hypothetical protein AOCH_006647 [Aspergillus ochraceoroseus]|uniref:S-adenosylmethionine-dependent methyltransferase-like protein n=1 Tax=Aspergillus ochraceoroseus TaxID=138278 RepID=A0A0F8VIQ3_9EURO|nr:hypothetical protein AOCH_006647 [Aspergillus ochraceoroseus]